MKHKVFMELGITFLFKSITEMTMYIKTSDIATIATFSAMWVVLNLTVGPLGFTLLRLPVLCDFSVYFTLLLATWVSNKMGVPSMVGLIGSLIVMALRPPSTQMWGFLASTILFDILMTLCRHEIRLKPYNIAVTSIATMVSAYFAGVIIGAIFMSMTLERALTLWGIWHLVGGLIGLAAAIPVIGALERAGVKGIKGA
ncbi:MAG: hypothetical protein QXO50_03465 [Candidatus Bathyarchaeia archaeon]